MKIIEATNLPTSNATLNKLLLGNADLEYEDDDGKQIIDMLYEEFVIKSIPRQSLIDILYSQYEIDKHIHEYNHHTLVIFASLGLEHDKIIQVKGAYFAKSEIIDQFKYLDELKEDSEPGISSLADAQSQTLSNFLCYHKEYANVFALLDQSICRTTLANVNSELIVERRRGNFTYHNCSIGARGVIKRSADKYEFAVEIPTYRVSESTKHAITINFDLCKFTSRSLQLKKTNLTLEELVDLVHLFFEHLD